MEKSFSEHQADAGRARWAKVGPEARSAHAKKAAQKRWENHTKKKCIDMQAGLLTVPAIGTKP